MEAILELGRENRFHRSYRALKKQCWFWQKAVDRDGYGVFKVGIKRVRANRYAWYLANGAVPVGFHVLHKCDNRTCVNPEHLFLGTNADNVRDCIAKGRKRVFPGDLNPSARLGRDQIREIFLSTFSNAKLAKIHKVSKQQIGRIKTGKRWGQFTREIRNDT